VDFTARPKPTDAQAEKMEESNCKKGANVECQNKRLGRLHRHTGTEQGAMPVDDEEDEGTGNSGEISFTKAIMEKDLKARGQQLKTGIENNRSNSK